MERSERGPRGTPRPSEGLPSGGRAPRKQHRAGQCFLAISAVRLEGRGGPPNSSRDPVLWALWAPRPRSTPPAVLTVPWELGLLQARKSPTHLTAAITSDHGPDAD